MVYKKGACASAHPSISKSSERDVKPDRVRCKGKQDTAGKGCSRVCRVYKDSGKSEGWTSQAPAVVTGAPSLVLGKMSDTRRHTN